MVFGKKIFRKGKKKHIPCNIRYFNNISNSEKLNKFISE